MNRNILLAISILVFLAVAIFLIKSNRQLLKKERVAAIPTVTAAPQISENQTPSGKGSGLSTRQVAAVQAFYDWYFTCSKKEGGNCDFKNVNTVDAAKINELVTTAQGYNSIVCSQDSPTSFHIDHVVAQKPDMSTVYVVETFRAGSQQQVLVDVQEEDNTWKIVNITCPK